MRAFLVGDVHRAAVNCLHWSRNAMKLFSGDIEGRIICTEIDYTEASFARLSVLIYLIISLHKLTINHRINH